MLGTMVATARENESSDELWIFALAVGGSLGSGNGVPGEIAELMVDSGAAVMTCPPWIGADVLVGQELSPRKLVGASGHALRYYGDRELDFSVAARQVRVKFVVTDVMCPVPGVAKVTGQGFKVEFGQQACLAGMNNPCDAVGDSWISKGPPEDR